MPTRIKLVALALAIFAGTTLTAVSCSSDSTAPNQPAVGESTSDPGNQSRSLLDEHSWMGKYHNDALAYAFARIGESKSVSKLAQCRVGLAALKEFQKAYRKSSGRPGFDDLTLIDGTCETAAERAGHGIVPSFTLSTSDFRLMTDISATATKYMDQILYAVDNMSTVSGLQSTINKISYYANSTLPVLEAGAVAGTGSIAVSSADYWTAPENSVADGPVTAYSFGVALAPAENIGITPPSGLTYSVGTRAKSIIRADIVAAIGVLAADWWLGEVGVAKAAIKAAAASLAAGIWPT